MEFVAQPLKRVQLRDLARQLRELLGLENELYFPVMQVLEHAMPLLFDGFIMRLYRQRISLSKSTQI